MNPLIQYLLLSTICLSVLYLFFKLLLERETNFRLLRFYLVSAILISLLLPLNRYAIKLDYFNSKADGMASESSKNSAESAQSLRPFDDPSSLKAIEKKEKAMVNWKNIVFYLYISISIVFIVRLFKQIFAITHGYLKGEKQSHSGYTLIFNNKFKHSFSFFHLVFLNRKNISAEELHIVIAHEQIHAEQFHTLDLILLELLKAMMWFNPAVWMMKHSMQQIHEYLADEGVVQGGIDKIMYQAVLLNQVAEEKLILLSSSFNQSLIKKRILMITQKKFTPNTRVKVLMLIPLTASLVFAVACVNGQTHEKNPAVVVAISPTKMNVLYIGVDNPLDISVSGYNPGDLEIKSDNGRIEGSNGKYIAKPVSIGMARISVFAKGIKLKETEFRCKNLPLPVVAIEIDGKYRTTISGEKIKREDLLQATNLAVILETGDFDINFRVASFDMRTTDPATNSTRAEHSLSEKFTSAQMELIKSLAEGQKLSVAELKVVGPDGRERIMQGMTWTIIR